jgi:hypothetical protein
MFLPPFDLKTLNTFLKTRTKGEIVAITHQGLPYFAMISMKSIYKISMAEHTLETTPGQSLADQFLAYAITRLTPGMRLDTALKPSSAGHYTIRMRELKPSGRENQSYTLAFLPVSLIVHDVSETGLDLRKAPPQQFYLVVSDQNKTPASAEFLRAPHEPVYLLNVNPHTIKHIGDYYRRRYSEACSTSVWSSMWNIVSRSTKPEPPAAPDRPVMTVSPLHIALRDKALLAQDSRLLPKPIPRPVTASSFRTNMSKPASPTQDHQRPADRILGR